MSVPDVLRGVIRALRGRQSAPNWHEWMERRPAATPVYGPWNRADIARLRQVYPDAVSRILAAAYAARAHSFVLLGRGPFTPADPDRPSRDGYQPIDWRVDPASPSRFPGGFPHKTWNFETMRPGNADIKVPWELARCHHWVNLAQAWHLTGDGSYACEVQRQCEDFIENNPTGTGIQWTCTMDVAIRAVNWVLAWELLESCEAIDAAFRLRWVSALYAHAGFIRDNLENTYEVTSNHYLSNVVGLYFLGRLFQTTEAGRAWLDFAHSAIEHEMTIQVQADGSDFESSVPYHRLVTELFLAAARVAHVHGRPFGHAFTARLKHMVGFLATVLRPDGLMPQLGDADDGRLHVFGGLAQSTPQDPRHLFAPAASILDEPSWRAIGGPSSAAEAVWWGLPLLLAESPSLPLADAHFADAGIAVSRSGATYLAITNGRVGTRGFGNHKHNDLLSFEFHADGTAWLVDPGSYVYTSDPAARNLFRSVRYHNTLRVDGLEQNELKPEWLFRLFESALPECAAWRADSEAVEYTGVHHGFTREAGPVHERRFRLDRATSDLSIVDVLRGGTGAHRITWHFHCAPGTDVVNRGSVVELHGAGRTRTLRPPAGLALAIADGWYSPSYGVRLPCRVLEFEAQVELPDEREWRYSLSATA